MTPEQLAEKILQALTALVDDGTITVDGGLPRELKVERPKNPEHGDYATNVAMQLGKRSGLNPRRFAELLAAKLDSDDAITAVEIAGPGFINLRVAADAQGKIAQAIVDAGPAYGSSDSLQGQAINLEFISANPTGPLHLGHTRWAAVGDALARVLAKAGAVVTREFYVNDRGAQMDKFGASLKAAAQGQPIPEDGYHGAYILELAERIVAEVPGITELPDAEQTVAFREAGYERQLKEQQAQLEHFRTKFDVWYSERSLHEQDGVGHAIEKLRGQGHLYDDDGALWMRTTDFTDDKDRVLIRSNGEPTYFASDAAYYVNKRERGFEVAIYLLGADHHGYVNRLKAIAACAGDDPEHNIEILIGQLVKILKGGEEMKLSKRAGTIVTLAELVEEGGVDPLRYTLCRYPVDSPLTLDIEEMTRQVSENPVYYVQYAHARLASILRNADDLGIKLDEFDPGLLSHDREGDLLRALAEFPRIVATAAELREPHRIARYLEDTASAFHKFYDSCRVLPRGDEEVEPVHKARLTLVGATRTVLANGLDLLGVSAPERM
ncbi:arginyl-tRNA synthetase [Kribbella flavida DSM 17836]|uniref:Arginine--tRNA ligase n=1 Tax=Kribbella flavida (strain DSM 17836 / JCM 10339 / NBRC 14399) TaxID=479435 RepID=D2Q3G1_KRIFD|nr:arginine--tRNA ligase [Kribbella flavida]ADB34084.1 arginyl-tRNA synthetase [Kribbella flavida DSM 17836]